MVRLLLTVIISGESLYLPDLERCLKLVLAPTREQTCLLLHHLVITWRRPNDGVIYFLCQTQTLAVQSTVRLSDTLHAAMVIRGVGASTVLWEVEPQSLCRNSPFKQ